MSETLNTGQKAHEINAQGAFYGTFAEIGAGQEVARWFFMAGSAAKTVAKTISAYDMAVSDAIYGPADRYVSRRRLLAMLEYEYNLLLERLAHKRGDDTCFFAFADTVATRREGGDGWMGVRFQASPCAAPSDVFIHVRMLDKESARQREALGVMGVNLLHGAFRSHGDPAALIGSLLDDLTWERVEVDMIHFAGPAFAGVDNRRMALQLVRSDLTEAVMLSEQGEPVQWAEVLHNKPVMVLRGRFRPITRATLDVLDRGLERFLEEPDLKGEAPVVLLETTLRHHRGGGQPLSAEDFLQQADLIKALGRPLLLANFLRFHRLAGYLARYTNRPIGIALGASTLAEIFDEKLYNESEGGLLGGLGQLFKNPGRLYVYPHVDPQSGAVTTAETFRTVPHLRHLYRHLVEGRFIQGVRNYSPALAAIRKQDVLARIAVGDPAWEELVPRPVAAVIRQRHFFGCAGS